MLLGGKGFNAVLSLAYLALSARALGIEQFGVLVLIHGFAQTVSDLVKFQSWQLVLHYGHAFVAKDDKTELQRLLRFSGLLDVGSGMLGAGIAMVGVLWFGPLLGWPEQQQPLAMAYMSSIVFMVNATPTGVLRLLDRFDVLAMRSAAGGLVRFLGAAAAYAMGAGLSVFLAVWYLASVWGFLVLAGSAVRELRRRWLLSGILSVPGRWVPQISGMWSFVWANNFNATLSMAYSRIGLLFAGALIGADAAALYRVGQQVADAMAKPARLVVVALYPELVRMRAEGNTGGLGRVSWRLTLGCGLAATLLLAAVAVAGGPALGWVMGAEFAAASTIMTLLFASATIGVWALPLEPLLISVGRSGAALGARFAVTILFLPLLYACTLKWGLMGAGAAAIAGAVGLLAAQFLPVLRWFRLQALAR